MAYLPSTHQPANQPARSNINTAVVKNWKTSLIGFILAFSGFVAYSPNNFGGENALIVQLCKYINIGGLATLGLVAQDFNSNGSKQGAKQGSQPIESPDPDASVSER